MKRFAIFALTGLFLACFVGAAFAWEMELKGESIWRYRYFTRTGNMDIFGPVGGWPNLGINHLMTYPSPLVSNQFTSTYGVIAGEPSFGSDKDFNDFKVSFFPKLKVNGAIEMRGEINLTSLGIHSAGQPYDDRAGWPGMNNELYAPLSNTPAGINVPNTFVTVPHWQITVKTPAVDLALGYRPTSRGIGLVHNPCARSSTALTITSSYGPLRFSWSPYFGRQAGTWGLVERDAVNPNNLWRKDNDRDYIRGYSWALNYSDGPFVFIINSDGWTVNAHSLSGATSPGTYVPRTPSLTTAVGAAPTATNGAITRGVSSGTTPGAFPAAGTVLTNGPDEWVWVVHGAMKYFNGRFFFNAEVQHAGRWRSGRGAATIAAVGGFGAGTLEALDGDRNSWIYGVEMGTVAGPLKTTLTYFRATGDDPNTRKTNEEAGTTDQGVSSCYVRDWAYLMYYNYGTGNYWDASGKGAPSNLHHAGARLDYAVASNLNIFGVYSYAWRDQPNAFQLAGSWLAGAQRFNNDTIATVKTGGLTALNHAAVPDHARSIGWEINAGWDWKILENFTWGVTAAYWKPGNWWAHAYPNTVQIYKGTALAVAPAATNRINAEADMGRDIDALVALETTLKVEF